MVNVIINEIQNTIAIYYKGPFVDENKQQDESHSFSINEVYWHFDETGRRWIVEWRKDEINAEHEFIFDFPSNEVYIKYITPHLDS